MRPRHRLRRMLKCSGLALSVLIGFAWCASIPARIIFPSSSWSTGLAAGGIGLISLNMDAQPPQLVRPPGVELDLSWAPDLTVIWMPQYSNELPALVFILPLCFPFLLFAVPTGLLFWRDRDRLRPNHCGCGYDLTGNTSGVCPECGERI